MGTSVASEQGIEKKGAALTWTQVRDRLPPKLDGGEWSVVFVRALMKKLGAFKFARTLYLYERDLDRYLSSLTQGVGEAE